MFGFLLIVSILLMIFLSWCGGMFVVIFIVILVVLFMSRFGNFEGIIIGFFFDLL